MMATDPLDVGAVLRPPAASRGPGCRRDDASVTCTSSSTISTRAAAFYHAGLGLDKVVWSYPGALFLSAGGYHHHLGTNTWAAGASRRARAMRGCWSGRSCCPSGDDAAARRSPASRRRGRAVVTAAGEGTATDPWGTTVRVRGERVAGQTHHCCPDLAWTPPTDSCASGARPAAPRHPQSAFSPRFRLLRPFD